MKPRENKQAAPGGETQQGETNEKILHQGKLLQSEFVRNGLVHRRKKQQRDVKRRTGNDVRFLR